MLDIIITMVLPGSRSSEKPLLAAGGEGPRSPLRCITEASLNSKAGTWEHRTWGAVHLWNMQQALGTERTRGHLPPASGPGKVVFHLPFSLANLTVGSICDVWVRESGSLFLLYKSSLWVLVISVVLFFFFVQLHIKCLKRSKPTLLLHAKWSQSMYKKEPISGLQGIMSSSTSRWRVSVKKMKNKNWIYIYLVSIISKLTISQESWYQTINGDK